MANELPEYFDNIVLGQYAMTGVPLKVFANDRYYIIPSPEDVDDPLIGYGMMPSGKMEPFDYRDIEHIMVSGNKVDLATYTKALGDELKGVKKASDAKGGEEKKEEGGEEAGGEEAGGEEGGEEGDEAPKSPFESFDPFAKKWSLKALYEISKDEYNAQEDALKAEMEAGKAKIDAAKEKLGNLKKQPIDDGVNSTPIVESVISDILIIASESTTYEKFISELINQKLLKREDLKDSDLVDELKTMYRGQALGKRESVNEYRELSPKMVNNFKIGDTIKTQKGTYTITGFGRRANAFREFEAENEKGKPFNLRISLRGATGISAAAGAYNLNFPEQEEMLESILESAYGNINERMGPGDYEIRPALKKLKTGLTDDDVVFTIDDEKLDQMVNSRFSSQLNFQEVNGDSYYILNQKYFDRLIDLADSSGFDVDYENSEDSVLFIYENVNENHISEPYIFQVGDIVRNVNPQCNHYGSTGIVNAIQALDGDMGNIVKYIVTNFGDTFKPGMALMKTPDQLELMDENLYTGAERRKAVKGMLAGKKDPALNKGVDITIEMDDEDGDFSAGDYRVDNLTRGSVVLSGMGKTRLNVSFKSLAAAGYTINESSEYINEYGATPSKKNWLGWFVLNANLHGDLTAWKKGELIKAYKSDEKGYVFIYTGDYDYEAYDDIAQSDFNRIATSLDPTKHKKSYNYVKKLEKLNRLKDYEVIN